MPLLPHQADGADRARRVGAAGEKEALPCGAPCPRRARLRERGRAVKASGAEALLVPPSPIRPEGAGHLATPSLRVGIRVGIRCLAIKTFEATLTPKTN